MLSWLFQATDPAMSWHITMPTATPSLTDAAETCGGSRTRQPAESIGLCAIARSSTIDTGCSGYSSSEVIPTRGRS